MIFAYFFVLFLLSIYSYSQIDLNLTLLQTPWFLSFKSALINLGYYNRPLSTVIFTVLVLLLYIIKPKKIILAIGGVCLISLLSYPFLSHDFFNYIFDARIVTLYHQNPYFFKALDFPNDTWIRFMQWTHRTYPYGPVWLVLTIIPSFLGFGKFILTLLNFKLLFTAAYILNCYLVNKINPKNLKFFALNPLIILETLYSPHNEALMLTFLLLAVYLYKNKKLAVLNLFLSGGIKFLTWILTPFIFLDREKFIKLSLILVAVGLIPVVWQREAYPWYLVTLIGLVATIQMPKLQKFLAIFSFGLLLRYVPFLFVGSYPPEVTLVQNIITVISLLCGLKFLLF
ncbi:MAG: hypothetical protein AAB838_01125 [Patescibacteria group bacterium]